VGKPSWALGRDDHASVDQLLPSIGLWSNRAESGNGLAVLRHGDLATAFHLIEIARQLILELSNPDLVCSCIHRKIVVTPLSNGRRF